MFRKAVTAGTLISMLLIGACSFGTTSSGPAANRTLTVETVFSYDSLDPVFQSADTSILIDSQMYQSLLQVDPTNPSIYDPYLAESYVASPDGLSVTFKLRHDVRFSDGTPMTSADVLFSFNRAVNTGSGTGTVWLPGLTFSAPDAYTVIVSSPTPDLGIVRVMAYPSVVIANSAVVKANGGTDATNASTADKAQPYFNNNSAGSGPYVLVSNDPGVQVVLKANPNYWGPKPAYSQLVFRNVPSTTQFFDVQKSQNIAAMSITSSQASTLDKSKYNVTTTSSADTQLLDLSPDPTLSTDANFAFRQAVKYAIDYKQLVQLTGLGAVQAQGLLATGVSGALPADQLVSRDVAKAKSFLTQSGITNPALTLTYATDDRPEGLDPSLLAQQIQANLSEVGITVTLAPGPSTTVLQSMINFKLVSKNGKMQALLKSGGGEDINNLLFYVPDHRGIGNFVGWKTGTDPALDDLIKQFTNATTVAQRDALGMQISSAVNTDAVFIPLVRSPFVLVSSKDVHATLVPLSPNIRFWLAT